MKGEEYVTAKGKTMPAKSLQPEKICRCSNKCNEKITVERRIQIHQNFYTLSWGLKNAFISGQVETVIKKRTYTKNENSRRNCTRVYKLNSNNVEVKVCKTYFKDTLVICDGTITNSLKRKSTDGAPLEDKRGKHEPANKSKPADINYLCAFINTFPAYHSHYSRNDNENRKYLSPDLNIVKLYELYKEKCEGESIVPLSSFVFRKIFNTNFNLHFHRPQTDTCQRCDKFKAELQSTQITDEQRNQIITERELHQRKAQAVKETLKRDIEDAKNDPTRYVFTFDLQKTLATPVLKTGVAYYKRQMWTYNLGVHDEISTKGFMYMWAENEASRGTQEVASCLFKHMKEHLPNSVTHLTVYSDACGGQNRNIKMVLMLTDFLQKSETLKVIEHKFFVSGHSFNSCDRDFAIIEKAKKYHNNIFIPDDWLDMIKNSKKKSPRFGVYRMKKEDFFSSKSLEGFITNRKCFIDGTKVQWLKTGWIKLEKDNPLIIKMKQNYIEADNFYELDLWPKKKGRRSYPLKDLDILYPNGKELTTEKIANLLFLTQYIPPVYHEFYRNLKGNPNATDFLENPDPDNSPSDRDE